MSRIRPRSGVVAAVLVIGVSLAACSSGGPDSAPPPQPSHAAANPSEHPPTRLSLAEGETVICHSFGLAPRPVRVELTLHSLDTAQEAPADPLVAPEDAVVTPRHGRFVALNVTVKNVGTTAGLFYPQPYHVSTDGKRTEHITGASDEVSRAHFGGDDMANGIANQELAPGQYVEGIIVYDVPQVPGKIVIPGAPLVEIPLP